MISNIISKLYNILCWSVRQGHGSFLIFEFGQPSLVIKEPLSNSIKKKPKHRKVTLHGEWHLWIQYCLWEIYLNNELAAHSESLSNEVVNALRYIDGQKIIKAEVDPYTANTIFYFDLGGILKTKCLEDETSEQWSLFETKGNVLSVRSDGMFCYEAEDTPIDKEVWKKISL